MNAAAVTVGQQVIARAGGRMRAGNQFLDVNVLIVFVQQRKYVSEPAAAQAAVHVQNIERCAVAQNDVHVLVHRQHAVGHAVYQAGEPLVVELILCRLAPPENFYHNHSMPHFAVPAHYSVRSTVWQLPISLRSALARGAWRSSSCQNGAPCCMTLVWVSSCRST